MAEVRGRRERPVEGFYRFLNSLSSADDIDTSQKRRRLNCTSSDSGSDLPHGCYKVERLVSKRAKRVSKAECRPDEWPSFAPVLLYADNLDHVGTLYFFLPFLYLTS